MNVMLDKSSREEELKKQGWVKQFTYDEPRLSEAAELYESLGFEVYLEPLRPNELDMQQCMTCYETMCSRYKTIYIKKKKGESKK